MVDAGALCDGVRLAPGEAAVGAAVAHYVDILREVALVEFTFVGDDDDAAVFSGDDARDTVVHRAVVAGMIELSASEQGVVLRVGDDRRNNNNSDS